MPYRVNESRLLRLLGSLDIFVKFCYLFYCAHYFILIYYNVYFRSDDELLTILRDHLQHKKASHGGMEFLEKTRDQNRAMTSIGG